MSNNITLRAATLADAKAITEVYITSRKTFVAFAPLVHSDESVYQWIHDIVIPSESVTVVLIDEKIVGMMALSKQNDIGWIEQLYLAPSSVGHGIGTLLVNQAKETLGAPIRLCTFQENINAQRFYERHGFRVIELRDGSANEEQCPDAVYEWL